MRHFIPWRYIGAGIVAALAVGTALVITSLGAAAGTPTPGSVSVDPGAPLTDARTGNTYTFGLRAIAPGAGGGDVVLGLEGPALSVCTVHGDGASVDFTDVGYEGGNSPSFECGRAYGMTVRFQGCSVTIRDHGFQHSDDPFAEYLGPTTTDIKFQKTGPSSGTLDVVDWNPTGKLEVKGAVSGTIAMSTCP